MAGNVEEIGRPVSEPDQFELIPNDPDSEACTDDLTEVVAEVLWASIALGTRLDSSERIKVFAERLADRVLYHFTLRPRRPQDRFTTRPKRESSASG